MSFRRVSVSNVLDRLQAWGEQPVVNPVKPGSRVPAAAAPSEPQDGAHLAGLVLYAFGALAAIFGVWLLTTSASVGFIYAQF